MKKYLFLGICALILASSMFLINCGQQTTTPTTTTTTTTAGASITLSGTLNSGSISAAGVKSYGVLSDYIAVAINNVTGQLYNSTTDASGNFSIEIPSGTSYEVSLIDSASKYFGPIVMVGDSSSTEVVMGITPNEDIDLGSIIADLTDKFAQPSTAPSDIANYQDTVESISGIPKGVGNNGKQTNSGITTLEGVADLDKDGIPNLFDGDEDNDGIWNGILAKPSSATVVSNTVESVWIDSNIWADHNTTEDAKDIIHLRIHAMPRTGKSSEITSAEVVSAPSSISNVATIMHADSLGDPTSYPIEGSLWVDDGLKLYLTTTLADNHWIVSVVPRAIMHVGDVFTIRVHYTGGGYDDFFVTTAYVLTDWAKILTYNGTTMPTAEGVSNDPVTYSSNTLEVTFSKPLDETFAIIKGLSYSMRSATSEYDASAQRYLVPTDCTEVSVTDPGASIATLEATVSTVTAETYYVTPVAESLDGQRNGEEVWFTKQ